MLTWPRTLLLAAPHNSPTGERPAAAKPPFGAAPMCARTIAVILQANVLSVAGTLSMDWLVGGCMDATVRHPVFLGLHFAARLGALRPHAVLPRIGMALYVPNTPPPARTPSRCTSGT